MMVSTSFSVVIKKRIENELCTTKVLLIRLIPVYKSTEFIQRNKSTNLFVFIQMIEFLTSVWQVSEIKIADRVSRHVVYEILNMISIRFFNPDLCSRNCPRSGRFNLQFYGLIFYYSALIRYNKFVDTTHSHDCHTNLWPGFTDILWSFKI